MPNEFPPHSPFIWSQARPRREGKTRPILPSGVSWVHPHVRKVWREESRLVGSVWVELESNQVKDDLNGTSLLNTTLTVFFKIFSQTSTSTGNTVSVTKWGSSVTTTWKRVETTEMFLFIIERDQLPESNMETPSTRTPTWWSPIPTYLVEKW